MLTRVELCYPVSFILIFVSYTYFIYLCKFDMITDLSSTFPRHTEFETSTDVKKSTLIEVT